MGNMDAISRQYRQRTGLDNVEEPETEPTPEVEPETELAKEVPAEPAPEAAAKTK